MNSGLYRGLRGGSWDYFSIYMRSSYRSMGDPATGDVSGYYGFRVALVPEPSGFVLAALGLVGLVVWRRRKRSWR